MRTLLVAALVAVGALPQACNPKQQPPPTTGGSFSGELKVAFLAPATVPDDRWRNARLLESFSFRDSKGTLWEAPADYITDGASIPWGFWSTGIAPFDGPYRDAAVLHDYYCEKNGDGRAWQAVQDMFLEASLARGTSESVAKQMYGVVLIGGFWNRCIWNEAVLSATATKAGATGGGAAPALRMSGAPVQFAATQNAAPPQGEELRDMQELQEWIKRENPTFEQIKERALLLNRQRVTTEPGPAGAPTPPKSPAPK